MSEGTLNKEKNELKTNLFDCDNSEAFDEADEPGYLVIRITET
jgi:hypothetical protein